MSCPVDESFDPLSPEYLADPYAVLAALPHREQPVFFAPAIGYFVLTRYDDIAAVFRDPGSYSAALAQAPLGPITEQAQKILLGAGHKPQPSMVSLDEPEHARLRKPAARAFSMKRVAAMVPAIEAPSRPQHATVPIALRVRSLTAPRRVKAKLLRAGWRLPASLRPARARRSAGRHEP